MFEVPDAKRVCREDIKSPPSSRSSSAGDSLPDIGGVDAFQHVYTSTEPFTGPIDTSRANDVDTGLERTGDESEEQEFEFRLFHSRPRDRGLPEGDAEAISTKHPAKIGEGDSGNISADGVQKLKIRLRSPSPGKAGEGGFVVPFRGWDYYLSNPEMVMRVLDGHHLDDDPVDLRDGRSGAREKLLDVAVSGEEVLAWAKSTRWPGCNLPWRVIRLQDGALAKVGLNAQQASAGSAQSTRKKKSKPNKKRRIILRKRAASKTAADEAEREKRARRNREKKIKRRQKERDRKAAMRDATAPADDGSDGGED